MMDRQHLFRIDGTRSDPYRLTEDVLWSVI